MLICVNLHGPEIVEFLMEDLQNLEKNPNLLEERLHRAGGISQAVLTAISNRGYELGYACCGLTGWDLGVILLEEEALLFEEFISTKFTKAIKYGMLTVSTVISEDPEETY